MIEEFLSYIFRNFFGHIIIAISVLLAALTFTKYGDRKEEKLTEILTLLKNQPANIGNLPTLPTQLASLTEKGQKDTPPTPTRNVEEELQKMTRHKERIKEEKQNEA